MVKKKIKKHLNDNKAETKRECQKGPTKDTGTSINRATPWKWSKPQSATSGNTNLN